MPVGRHFVSALLGLLALTAGGWRSGLLLPLLTLVVLFLVMGRVPMPAPPIAAAATAGRLPRGFWAHVLLVALAVGIEFCVLFFSVPLLSTGSRLTTAGAAAALSLFVAGELSGRAAGSWLTRRPGRATRLIGASLGVAMAGFSALWLVRVTGVAVVALFVTGLGIGNLYPLSLAWCWVRGAAGPTRRCPGSRWGSGWRSAPRRSSSASSPTTPE